jgi:hypothetical protein
LPRRALQTPAPGGPVDEALLRDVIGRVREWHLGPAGPAGT